MRVVQNTLWSTAYAVAFSAASYLAFLAILTIPFFQNHVIYLHKLTLTWFNDVNFPEQWGFLHNQVTPFNLLTEDGQTLHAWHILPLGLYNENAAELVSEPAGLAADVTARCSFRLLRDDPEALLVLYLHGAGGTLGSGWRPPSYRALYAMAPTKIHTVAIDYRGFGRSTGSPSEEGLLEDALALAKWAMEVAKIPPSRIVLFGQSLGTAVTISLAQHLGQRPDPVLFSGMILVAPFLDVESLTTTYRVAGMIPLLDPVARSPPLLAFFNTFIRDKWLSKDKLVEFIRLQEEPSANNPSYFINFIHAEDDFDIPWTHSRELFWLAVNATYPLGAIYEEFEMNKKAERLDLGLGGSEVQHQTPKGVIREQILKHGLHDKIMSYPVVSLAILRAFQL